MQLELTAEEQEHLIWEPGDHFEIIPGIFNITQVDRQQPGGEISDTVLTTIRFFFDSLGSSWGDKEWTSHLSSEVPNGPALLVVLRRGTLANVFGVVNGAWSQAEPLLLPLYRNSTGGRQFVYNQTGRIIVAVIAAIVSLFLMVGFVLIPLVFLLPSLRKRLYTFLQPPDHKHPGQAANSGRALLHRIAKNAQAYWPVDANAPGKL
jgi:hypothetical protein